MLDIGEIDTMECCRIDGKVHVIVTHRPTGLTGEAYHRTPSEARDLAILELQDKIVRWVPKTVAVNRRTC